MSNPFFNNTRIFIPGTVADANEINSQFNDLAAAFNLVDANLFAKAGGTITGNLTVNGTTSLQGVTATTLSTSGAATLASLITAAALITGGSVNATQIGNTTPSSGAFTTLASSGAATLASITSAAATITGGSINNTVIGNTTPVGASFSNLSYIGTLTGGTGVINIGSGQIVKDAAGLVGIGLTPSLTQLQILQNTTYALGFNTAVQNYSFRIDPGFGNALVLGSRTNSVDFLTIDSAGNAGLGVVPSAWAPNYKPLEFTAGSIYQVNNNQMAIVQNGFNNGTNWIYKFSEQASFYNQASGDHNWFTAPSGTAGSPITFTQAMTLTQDGRLLVGGTSSPLLDKLQSSETLGIGFGGSGGQINYFGDVGGFFEFVNRMNTPKGFKWYVGPSGLNNPMTLTAAGNLMVGADISDLERLYVSGGRLRVSSGLNLWSVFGSDLSANSYSVYLKGGTTTPVGLIGTDGGGILGGGVGDNFGIRAEGALLLLAGASERARITSTGNILVGRQDDVNGYKLLLETGASGAGLEILASNQTASSIQLSIGGLELGIPYIGTNAISNGLQVGTQSSTAMQFVTGAIERARVTQAGNLLVGTQITPLASNPRLVAAASGASFLQISDTGNNLGTLIGASGGAQFQLYTHTGPVGGEAYIERARVSLGGYFKATSSNLYNANGLSANGDYHQFEGNTPNSTTLIASTVNIGVNGAVFETYANTNATGFFMQGIGGGSLTYRVRTNGNVENLNNSYGALSDAKLKNVIGPVASYWEKYKLIEWIKYTLKDDPTDQVMLGVIAQQVRGIFPGLIIETPDMVDVVKTREVTKTVPVTTTEVQESTRTEIVLEGGKYVQKTVTESKEVQVPVIDEFPVYDENGQPAMQLVTPAVEAKDAVLDEDGNVVEPAVEAQDAVYAPLMHKVPRTETITETEEYTEKEPNGEVTLSVKYSILGHIADVVLQEVMKRTEESEAEIQILKARIEALEQGTTV